ncbi:hypothetical protein J6590_012213 [Homalodisca vitripennis]|nr:hypothetical protein J6590_012213 [Homalodisca vitripennis]
MAFTCTFCRSTTMDPSASLYPGRFFSPPSASGLGHVMIMTPGHGPGFGQVRPQDGRQTDRTAAIAIVNHFEILLTNPDESRSAITKRRPVKLMRYWNLKLGCRPGLIFKL